MSYKEGKNGKVELVCNHKGCTNKVTADKKGEAWQKAKSAGWLGKSAAEHYCVTHKEEHGARPAKKANGKGKKETAKSTKKAGLVRKASRPGVVSYGAADEG